MSEPRTQAGCRPLEEYWPATLIAALDFEEKRVAAAERERVSEAIVAIEAEARPSVEELTQALIRQDVEQASDFRAGDKTYTWERKAERILAALRDKPEAER